MDYKPIIAVHCGAGYHRQSSLKDYKRMCRRACIAGMKILKRGGSAKEACEAATAVLEDDPLSNSGTGSNLTATGTVECDASVMCGRTGNFGGVGAVRGVPNPVLVAGALCTGRAVVDPYGRVPPLLLVGDGALTYARDHGIRTCDPADLISKRAKDNYTRHLKLISSRLDTVGAVCLDSGGCLAASCSSGGIAMKPPGRVGQAAHFGCGVWADDMVAVSTTGCGEYLVLTGLARVLAERVRGSKCPVTAVHDALKKDFVDSPRLLEVSEKLAGVLVLSRSESHVDLLYAHTTPSMVVAYMGGKDLRPQAKVSEMPLPSHEGKSVVVHGSIFQTR